MSVYIIKNENWRACVGHSHQEALWATEESTLKTGRMCSTALLAETIRNRIRASRLCLQGVAEIAQQLPLISFPHLSCFPLPATVCLQKRGIYRKVIKMIVGMFSGTRRKHHCIFPLVLIETSEYQVISRNRSGHWTAGRLQRLHLKIKCLVSEKSLTKCWPGSTHSGRDLVLKENSHNC